MATSFFNTEEQASICFSNLNFISFTYKGGASLSKLHGRVAGREQAMASLRESFSVAGRASKVILRS